METARARTRDAALLHLVSHGGLGALRRASTLLHEGVDAAWGEQATLTVDRDVPAAGTRPLCGVLAQLRGALVVDGSNCSSVLAGTTVQLPQAASIRILACLVGEYSLMLPATFATWPQLKTVTWGAGITAPLETAALAELFATAPVLKTLTLEAYLEANDADLLGALARRSASATSRRSRA